MFYDAICFLILNRCKSTNYILQRNDFLKNVSLTPVIFQSEAGSGEVHCGAIKSVNIMDQKIKDICKYQKTY